MDGPVLSSPWGGTGTTLLEAFDGVQRKAKRPGIIPSYVPIGEFITAEDTRLTEESRITEQCTPSTCFCLQEQKTQL